MRYRKRRYRAPARHRLPIGAIVGIVAAAALLAAIVVGNILNSCLDDETYRRLTEGETTEEVTETPEPPRTAPRVTAYPFRLGSSLRTLGDDPPSALALPINNSEGELLYRSPVVEHLGRAVAENAAQNAERSMSSLLDTVPYLIGIWQVSLPSGANENVLQAAAATDAAILREFLSMGGSELLLIGLDWEDGFETSYAYLTALADSLDERTVLSVAVPLQVAKSEVGRDVLYALDRLLPLLTLDLTGEADVGLPTDETDTADESGETDKSGEPTEQSPLREADYYLTAYGMRLLLAESQTNLLRSAAETAPDLAVLAASAR